MTDIVDQDCDALALKCRLKVVVVLVCRFGEIDCDGLDLGRGILALDGAGDILELRFRSRG